MTGEERQALRQAINAKVREHRNILIRDGEEIVCAGCGADSDSRTIGCKVCAERHLKRQRRADEQWRRLMQDRQNERRRRKRLGIT